MTAPRLKPGERKLLKNFDRELALRHIAENPGYYFKRCAEDFWNAAIWFKTDDPKRGLLNIPFPLDWPHLHRVHEQVEKNRLNAFLKDRQLLLTWYFCERFLWKSNFAQGDEVFRGVFFSKSEDDAAELIRRCRYTWGRLPRIFQRPLVSDNVYSLEFDNGSMLQAFADTPHGARQYVFSEVYSTEAAFQQYAAQKWGAVYPTIMDGIGKFSCDSTPGEMEGIGKWFFDLWHNADSAFAKMDLYWNDVPGRDAAWLERVKKEMGDERSFKREFGHAFGVVEGDPLFSKHEYSKDRHVKRVEPDPSLPIRRGWDFGYRMPACIFFQYKPSERRIRVLGEVCGKEYQNITLPQFARKVIEVGNKWFGSTPWYWDAGDPAGNAKNEQTDFSDIDLLGQQFGIQVETKDSVPEDDILAIRLLLADRADGQPGLLFDDRRCPILTAAFETGLVMEKTTKLRNERHKKDGFYEHPFDGLRYGIVNTLSLSELFGGREMDVAVAEPSGMLSSYKGKQKEKKLFG